MVTRRESHKVSFQRALLSLIKWPQTETSAVQNIACWSWLAHSPVMFAGCDAKNPELPTPMPTAVQHSILTKNKFKRAAGTFTFKTRLVYNLLSLEGFPTPGPFCMSCRNCQRKMPYTYQSTKIGCGTVHGESLRYGPGKKNIQNTKDCCQLCLTPLLADIA